jgi:DNA-binding response OmpR family regulator
VENLPSQASETLGRVLVVEDDPTVAEVVERYLRREGFEVTSAADGRTGLDRAMELDPDLIVLDIMLPGIDGLEVCRQLRARSPVPIIMLTALGEELDRVIGLELGADDYMAKPFSPRELTARVKSVLRRAGSPGVTTADPPQRLDMGELSLNLHARELLRDGNPVSLTVKEFDLLGFLMLRPRQVFTREQLLEQVWGYTFGDTSTVTVHVRRLREKIEVDPAEPKWIVTVWGVGYRFEP